VVQGPGHGQGQSQRTVQGSLHIAGQGQGLGSGHPGQMSPGQGMRGPSQVIAGYISKYFIFPVVMSSLDWVCVFIRETIQRVDFVTHML
jgi:hypothetical protein